MLKNFFKTSIRTLINGRLFTLINITGLAVGIACFIILSLFIVDELSYDNFYNNSDNIYRVYVEMFINGEENITSKTAAPTGPVLFDNFPEVVSYTRLGQFVDPVFKSGDKAFKEWEVFAVDSAFFDIFSIKFISGDPKTALTEPYTIILTEEMSRKYFGDESAYGKILVTEDNVNYLVTGVIENFPKNSHFKCNFITSIYHHKEHAEQDWLNLYYSTYIVLRDGTDPAEFEKKLRIVRDDYFAPQVEKVLGQTMEDFYASGNRYEFKIQPLSSIYLYSTRDYGIDLNSEWGEVKTSDISYVYIFSIVAVFILLIAVINFMNLSTARSEKRVKEVGIRKTLGSNKSHLIGQFITESIVISFISCLFALVLVELLLPLFNNLAGKELNLEFVNHSLTIPILLLGVIVVGILAGSYPAFYLSSFQPVQIFKNNVGSQNRKSKLRSILVIAQFSISITLLISTFLIRNQLEYMLHKNLGLNKDYLITIYGVDNLDKQINTFKQELLQDSRVISATYSLEIFRSGIPGSGYYLGKSTIGSPILTQVIDADPDFLDTYQINLKEGRFFREDFSTDTTSVVINETIVQDYAIEDPVGKIMMKIENDKTPEYYRIIGVVSNFNYESLHKNIKPLVIHFHKPRQNSVLVARLSSNELSETISYIKDTWSKFTGNDNLQYRFVDDTIARMYENEKRTSVISGIFTFIAIFIACLGLFALAAFVTEQKTKEIGIRKVLGASVIEITALLSKQFTRWVLIANLIAWPAAYYFIQTWLQDFAYRIEIGWSIFIYAALLALFIALITISFQTIKAALANPTDSLKYE